MGKFLLRFFAFIGFMVVLIGLIVGYGVYKTAQNNAKAPKAPAEMVLELDFTHPIVEQPAPIPAALTQFVREEEVALFDILRAIDRAKDDPRVKGIVARIGPNAPSLTHAQEIRAALEKFRQSGKFTYVFAPDYGQFGLGNRSYYLASAFEHIWLQPVGSVSLTGLSIQSPFAKSALAKIGVGSDFMQREEYKSYPETFTRDSFSEPARQNMITLLDNLANQLLDGVAKSRQLEPAALRTLAANGPYTANEALKEKLVTKIGYLDEMLMEAKSLSPNAVRMDLDDYLEVSAKPEIPKATIALIYGSGAIIDAEDGAANFSGESFITPNRIVSAFEDAIRDNSIKAIVFRIDSPGGSPTASESIRRVILRAKEAKKLVIVSMGATAASGGYWIAMDADHIVTNPGTLTGSIGVVTGKFLLGDLWNKLEVKWDTISTTPNANMWSPLTPFSDPQRARVNALLDETYTAFTTNVANGRKLPMTKMPELAKGRVWSGEQAVGNGLADELGGLHTAILAAKKKLNLQPTDQVYVKLLPPPETLEDLFLKVLKNYGVQGVMLQQMGGAWQQLRPVIQPVLDQSRLGPRDARLPVEYSGLAN